MITSIQIQANSPSKMQIVSEPTPSVKENKFLELTGLNLLDGRFRLLEEVLGGKSSTCYFGRDENSGTDIFVKLCIFPRSDLERARFKNEIDYLKLNAGFNEIIKKTPSYIADGELFDGRILYLVTERVHGTLLSDWLRAHWSTSDLQQRLLIAYRVFGANENFIHDTAHRDLHVGNIILLPDEIDLYSATPDFKTIVLDWGQCYCGVLYQYSENDDDHMVIIHNGMGKELTTSFYNLPPETFQDQEKPNTGFNKYDSWAMGLLLYKLITGKDLFSFKNIGHYASSLRRIENIVTSGCFDIIKAAEQQGGYLLAEILIQLMRSNPSERMSISKARHALWFILVEQFYPTERSEILAFLKNPNYHTGCKWQHYTIEEFDAS